MFDVSHGISHKLQLRFTLDRDNSLLTVPMVETVSDKVSVYMLNLAVWFYTFPANYRFCKTTVQRQTIFIIIY